VQTASIQASKRYLRAPANGKLLSTSLTTGSSVQPLQALWEFAPESALSVLMEVDELYAQQVKPGQMAFIRPLGLTDTLGRGTVVYVAPNLKRKSLFAETAGEAEDRRVREVRIRLNEGADDRVLLGARVEAIIRVTR
jgi:multidrug resistance efflux pump